MNLTKPPLFLRLFKKFAYKIISKLKIILRSGVRKDEPWFEIAKEALRLAAQKLPVKTKFIIARDYQN